MLPALFALMPLAAAEDDRCEVFEWMDAAINPIQTVRHDTVLTPAERYGPQLAFDGDPATAWCEGEPGHGEGKGITVVLDKPRTLVAIEIHGGYFKSADLLAANSRVRELALTASNGASGQTFTSTLTVSDPTVVPAADPCGETSQAPTPVSWFTWVRDQRGERVYLDLESGQSMPVDVIELDLSAVYPGSKYTDTCISEIKLIMRD